ncbi:hypothetical protein ACUZXZ_10645 [Pseudomonas juntendi]
MSQSLKTGDLALIIGAFSVTENIGRSVELVEFVPPFGSVFCQDGYFDADAPGLWIVTGEGLVRNAEGGKVISNLAGCDPQHLRPLRGDDPGQIKPDAQALSDLGLVSA